MSATNECRDELARCQRALQTLHGYLIGMAQEPENTLRLSPDDENPANGGEEFYLADLMLRHIAAMKNIVETVLPGPPPNAGCDRCGEADRVSGSRYCEPCRDIERAPMDHYAKLARRP